MSVIIDGTSGITSPTLDLTSGQLSVADGGTGVSTSTGSGNNVLSTSPTLVTPDLGTPSAVVLTNATGTSNSLNAGIGVGQTWTDVSGSRAFATTYTNSTGKPIQLGICIGTPSSANAYVNFSINGVIVALVGVTSAATPSIDSMINHIIPNGATYLVSVGTGSPSLVKWWELR